MTPRLIPAAGLSLCILGAACSRPSGSAVSAGAPRDLRLIEPVADPGPVSDLEAGRLPKVAIPEARRLPHASPAVALRNAPAPAPVAVPAAPEPEAAIRIVARTELPAPVPEVVLPATRGPALTGETGLGTALPGEADGGSRGPMILIRGGQGSARDDCKVHGMGGLGGFGGGGIAINRVTPPIGGDSPRRRSGGGMSGVRIR